MGKHTAQTVGLAVFTTESFYTHSSKSEWAALGTWPTCFWAFKCSCSIDSDDMFAWRVHVFK